MATKKVFRLMPVLLLYLLGLSSMAQLRNAHWITTHWVQFGSGTPTVFPLPCQGTGMSPASLSDPSGNLLLYSGADANIFCLRCADGSLMPVPGSFCNIPDEGALSFLMLPWPGDLTKVAAIRRVQTPGLPYGYQRIMVGCVDLTLNNGLGSMPLPPVFMTDSLNDKLTAVPHANGLSYWIIGQKRRSNAFHAYQLRPTGVDTVPVVSYAGAVLPDTVGGIYNPMQLGSLTASYDGTKLASQSYSGNPWLMDTSITEVFNFDAATGQVTLMVSLRSNLNYTGAAGIEFSPDGSKLYVVDMSHLNGFDQTIWQYDLTVPDPSTILGSEYLLSHALRLPSLTNPYPLMAAGPDGRIYLPHGSNGGWGPLWYGAIQEPNLPGSACDLDSNAIFLQAGQGAINVPNFCKRYHDSELSVGVREGLGANASLQAWPVPASDLLNVTLPEAGRLTVLDMLGRELLWQQVPGSGSHAVPIGELAPGTYVLRFTNERGVSLTRGFVRD